MRLILYSKPGCHLCEGLQEKLEQIQSLKFELEVRNITSREDWFQQYQYEVPVLFIERCEVRGARCEETNRQGNKEELSVTLPTSSHLPISPSPHPLIPLPRPSPRVTVAQLEQMLQKYLSDPAQ